MALTVLENTGPGAPAAAPAGRGRRRHGVEWPTVAVVAAVVAVLALLVLYPLARVLVAAFGPSGKAVLTDIVSSSVDRGIVVNTLVLGVVVGLAGTILGFLMAFVQVRVAFRGKRIVHLLCLLPVVSPPFAVATAIITLLGRRGVITHGLFGLNTNIYGLPGLSLVLALSFFPVAYMNFLGMLKALDPVLDEASANLGATGWQTFRKVTLPMLAPGFAASFLLLFVEAIADLANPLVIGGDYTVLASRAFIAITGEYDVGAGAAFSLVLLLPAILVFLVQRYWVSRKSVVSVTGKPAGSPRLITSAAGRIPLVGFAVLVGLVVTTIYATVILGGLVKILGIDNRFTLDNYRYVLSGIGNEAIKDTTILALIATPIAGLMGMLVAWLVVRKLRPWAASALDFLGMLGLAVPGTVLGIGYAVAFNTPLIVGNRMFLPALGGGAAMFGGALALVMVYVIRSMPSGQRSGIAALQQIDPSIDEAAASLGASSTTVFRTVTLPLIRPALLSGLIYAFARSMTTLSPIIFITTPQTQIMTKQILSEVDAGRFGNAFAFCTLLLVIVLAVMGLLTLLVHHEGRPARQTGGGAR
ncbi:ABC transporter permease [Mobilicoccus pelagius]|uniref:Putative ABC transporter permease protein n=1 Tax=Mobilicoccus pelagius NBRC 104925 TaxID=1089455 RepID=H5UQR9_9MICO|nr:iron ABC transporter permease [Mobilicoccus pelagius]GAB48077.1 putative ABC transporter permease protein [Mobilicoccus pelagius NBRC 104925]